jgi:putative FmdB family regulatory protein
MPTYEYRCRDCGEPLEVVQSFTDDPLTMCPVCGGELRKVFQAIAFKGSGFYKTDSRKAAKASSSSGTASEASGSSDAKSTSSGANGEGASSRDRAKSSSSSSSGSSSSSSSSARAKDT